MPKRFGSSPMLATHSETSRAYCLVVMLNPGSLRGGGSGLAKDETLRTLRTAFCGIANCLVLNLFDAVATKPEELFDDFWDRRDRPATELIHQLALNTFHPKGTADFAVTPTASM